jgi:hypothetical protein
MNFSASLLVKKSASQLLYFVLRKETYKVTPMQLTGEKYSLDIVKKNRASTEKRGILSINDHTLYFCIDYLKDNKLVEIKKVDDMSNYKDWYLEMSLVQSSFYHTLATKIKTLNTPTFMLKEGYKNKIVEVPFPFEFELWFGKDKYNVSSNDKLFKHYVKKMNVIAKGLKKKSFTEVREFDKKYKFKEFQIFKPKYKILT